MAVTSKKSRRERIKRRIRKRISGSVARPRLTVYRSNTALYVQLVDDLKGHTILSASSREFSDKKSANVEDAAKVGKRIAEKATAAGIEKVVFDRNGYLYHGKIKALAEAAREGGLKF